MMRLSSLALLFLLSWVAHAGALSTDSRRFLIDVNPGDHFSGGQLFADDKNSDGIISPSEVHTVKAWLRYFYGGPGGWSASDVQIHLNTPIDIYQREFQSGQAFLSGRLLSYDCYSGDYYVTSGSYCPAGLREAVSPFYQPISYDVTAPFAYMSPPGRMLWAEVPLPPSLLYMASALAGFAVARRGHRALGGASLPTAAGGGP
jgi:hypothetical protein